MTTNKIRVVIDPNIIASVLLGGITQKRYLWLLDNLKYFDICYSDKILEEIRHFPEVNYFKKKGITTEIIEAFLSSFQAYSLKIIVSSKVKLGRDANDYFLLSLCRDAKAKFLTTGDPDLLELEKYASTRILSMKDFVEVFQKS
ncbi:putative toxin-antitoxin system toxin component, PIN family [Emticicia sp. SJ17W-69]|uniref:putative toxin-antitoxin system toxin component, PIN family n=1 Tax=Emticicia sp. SJ17W-69 TaxID=3421657 RepID=UPI003EBB73B9